MPRAGLSTAVVVRAAADLADESGWQQLTLAAVATRLGVRQPSLYKHIGSLADLRRGISRLAVTELGDRLMVAVAGRSGADALRHRALADRAYARAHPGRYAASVIAPAPGDQEHARLGEAVLRTVAAVLRGYGLTTGTGGAGTGGDGESRDTDVPAGTPTTGNDVPGDAAGAPDTDALHAIRALRAMLHGFVALEAAGGFGLPLDLDESYRRMVAGLDAALRERSRYGSPDTPVTAR
jgi:AcrR family transcriptional regulator